MRDKHLLLAIVRLFSLRFHHPPSPLKGPRCRAGPVVAAQFRVMQEVPHEPDLRHTETVNNHELPVKTGVERLEVGRRGRSGDAKGSEALVAQRFDADQLEAHSKKDVVDGEQLHLEEKKK